MTIFRFPWFRRFVRRHMSPLPEHRAEFWKSRISILYAVVAWNALGWVGYMMATGRADWAKYHGLVSEEEANQTPAQKWSRSLNIQNATVYRVKGFEVQQYEINNDDETADSTTSMEETADQESVAN